MIAKCTRHRAGGGSSFAALARYIRDLKAETPKAQEVRVTNCESPEADLAVREIELTQGQNQRSQSDKTYHLVASFPAGERPTPKQLGVIEQRLCDAIGLGAHQRLSALHTDTAHAHLHIAINKVHPETFNVVTPHRDFVHLQAACRELEAEHGLTPLPEHARSGPTLSPPAAASEHHSGVASFASWVKGDAALSLKATLAQPGVSWADVHRTLAAYNLELRPRGAGLVVADLDRKLFVKAGNLGRDLTKAKLEQRLGAYERPGDAINTTLARQRYQPAPVQRDPRREALWQRYQHDKAARQDARRQAWAALKAERERQRQALKTHFAARRQALKRQRAIPGPPKKARYSLLKVERLAAQAVLQEEMARRQHAIVSDHKALTWNDFLICEAGRGSADALQVLRSQPQRPAPDAGADAVSPTGPSHPTGSLFRHLAYRIDRHGRITYTLAGGGQIEDDGKRLRVMDRSNASIETALRLAQARYGSALHITGSDAFKRQVVQAAVAGKLRVTFDDPEMEKARQQLMAPGKGERLQAPPPARQPERRGMAL